MVEDWTVRGNRIDHEDRRGDDIGTSGNCSRKSKCLRENGEVGSRIEEVR